VNNVKITYSRHARRRMRLYGIAQEDVEQTIAKPDRGPKVESNRYVVYRTLPKFGCLPLKVIYVLEGEHMVILSASPLKKAYGRHNQ